MSDGYFVDYKALPEPAARLNYTGGSVLTASKGVADASTAAGADPGNAVMQGAIQTFGPVVSGVLLALSEDYTLLAHGVTESGKTYAVTDANAVPDGK